MITYLAPLTIALPWFGAFLVWAVGNRRPRWQHALAVGVAAATAATALFMLPQANWHTTADPVLSVPFGAFVGDLTLLGDGLSVFLAVIAAVIGSLCVIYSVDYMNGEQQLGRYYALVLTFIGAMCGLVLSGNLFFLFLFWEVTAFCSYGLISFYNDDPRAVSAGLKALIITQIGGVGLLVGVLLAGAYLPDLQISTLLAQYGALPGTALAVLAFGFLLAAVAKSAQLPLYMWLPDAMEAPTPVSALIHAATMVNAGVYLLARFYPALRDVPGWTTTVALIGAATALFAALRAVFADDLKRVLAYSTVSQLGYMVAAIGIGAIFESQIFLFSHAIFKALLFLGAGAIIHAVGTRDMRRMGGLWKKMPWTGAAFLTGSAALAGLPFFNGFWSKELLLEAALEKEQFVVYGVLVLVAGITAFYTARMCWLVFFAPARTQENHEGHAAHAPQPFMAFALLALVAGTLTSWLTVEPFARWLAVTLPYELAYLPQASEEIAALISWEVVFALSTLFALGVIACGIGLWYWVSRRPERAERHGAFEGAVLGVDRAFDRGALAVAGATRRTAAALQQTQTGQLAWNVVGILIALVFLMALILGSM